MINDQKMLFSGGGDGGGSVAVFSLARFLRRHAQEISKLFGNHLSGSGVSIGSIITDHLLENNEEISAKNTVVGNNRNAL